MNEVSIPFGKKELKFDIPNSKYEIIDVEDKRKKELKGNEMKEIIIKFIQNLPLKGKKNISIAIPDITRPKIPQGVLEVILENLVKSFQGYIYIFIGTGLHSFTQSDMYEMIPRQFINHEKIRIKFHDANSDDNIYIGDTKKGTPIYVEKEYYYSDLKLSIGVVEPHQFAGFSGGSKGVVIGLGGEKTISRNHALIMDPRSRIGIIKGNPLREDIEEAGQMININYLINFVMNLDNKPMNIICGENPESFRKTVNYIKELTGYKVGKKYDLVITSPGGFPRDIDLYQAQKAITPALSICKDGGIILLISECPRGSGEREYLELIKQVKTPEKLVKNFDLENFKVGPHKSLLFAKAALNHQLYLYTNNKSMNNELSGTFINPIKDITEFLKENAYDKTIAILPRAIQVLPVLD